MARPSSKRKNFDSFVPLEGLRFEDVKLKGVETRDEAKARLLRESHEAKHRVWRDSILFGTLTLGVSLVAVVCLWIALKPGQESETQKWATTLLTTIVSAGVGYLTGKASKMS